MKKLLGAAMMAVLLTACGTSEKQQLSVAALCHSYGLSLKEVAAYRAKMDAKAQAVVEEVRAALNPVCLSATPPSATEAATTAAMAGLGRLSTVIALVK
jgi:hypothetical protein